MEKGLRKKRSENRKCRFTIENIFFFVSLRDKTLFIAYVLLQNAVNKLTKLLLNSIYT